MRGSACLHAARGGHRARHVERGARLWRHASPCRARCPLLACLHAGRGGHGARLWRHARHAERDARLWQHASTRCPCTRDRVPALYHARKHACNCARLHARLHAVLGCARVRLPYALYVLRAQARLARSVHIAQVRAAYAPHGEYAACFVRKGARKYAPRTRRMAPGGALRAQIAQFSA